MHQVETSSFSLTSVTRGEEITETIKTWLFTHVLFYKWTCIESCSAAAQTARINLLSQKPYVLISSSAVKHKPWRSDN